MSQAIGDAGRIRMKVVLAVARLYGTAEGRARAARWGLPLPL
jgi:hypothetical protein